MESSVVGEFCVLCGRSDQALEDGLCADCFARKNPLVGVPAHPRVVLCPTCGARKLGQHWEGSGRSTLLGADDLTPLLEPARAVAIREVRWTEVGGDTMRRELEGEVRARFRGTEHVLGVRLTVQLEHRTCPECSRRSGHYYTSIIQMRSAEGGPRESARERRERLDRAFHSVVRRARPDVRKALSWQTELPEGIDYFLTDTLSARALARLGRQLLGGTVTESASLYGRKDGRELYRVTFCLRVPPAPGPESPPSGPAGRSSNGRLKKPAPLQSSTESPP